MNSRQVARIVVLVAMFVACSKEGSAQTDPVFDAKGLQKNRIYFSALPVEQIDMASGALTLTFTDLALPGDAGRELRFQRTYSSKSGYWTFGIEGLIMRVSDGWPNDLATNPSPTLFTSDGGAPTAAIALSTPVPGNLIESLRVMMTDRFWKYDRSARNLWLPDGTVSHFENGRLESVKDSLGNLVLALSWEGAIVRVRQHLSPGRIREVIITLADPGNCILGLQGCLPSTMTFDNRTWSYSGGTVTPPEGPGSSFDGSVLTTPQGGRVEYDFQLFSFRQLNDTLIDRLALRRRRQIDVRGQSNGTWIYDFAFDIIDHSPKSTVIACEGLLDATNCTAANGTVTTFFHAFMPGWTTEYMSRYYLPTRRTIQRGGQELEVETRSYTAVSMPTGGTLPELQQVRIERGTRTFTTTFEYNASDFGDFHTPWRITEVGELTRTTTRTFRHTPSAPFAATPYVLAMPLTEATTVGAETFSQSWDPDPATGFVRSATVYGLTTTFQPDSHLNVASATKANGKVMLFSYDWGQLSQTTTPGVTTTRTFNEANGTVTSEAVAGRTTTFLFDDLFRVTRVDPPGGTNPLITAYPDGATAITGRGSSQLTTTFDGFGRPVHTINAIGVQTSATFDAQGRKLFVSLPYDSSTPMKGTEYAYDGLGRVTCEATGAAHCLPSPSGAYRLRVYSGNTVTVYDENSDKGPTSPKTVLTYAAFGSPDDARLISLLDADNKLWSYGYNAVGSLISVAGPSGTGNRTWERTPASHDLVLSETHPESGTTTYSYDNAGVLQTKKDANNTTLTYLYDDDDRLKSIAGGGQTTTITYEPGTNNRKTMSIGAVSTEFEYHQATGRLEARRDVIEGATFVTTYDYDANDNVWKIRYPSGRYVRYTRNSENQITSVENEVTSKPYAFDFVYHPSGGVKSYKVGQPGNPSTTTIVYDTDRHLVTSIQSSVLQLTYGYDNVGNVTSIQAPSVNGGNQTFTYDVLDRLKTVNGTQSVFEYDAHGNRQTSSTGAYTYIPGKPFHLQTAAGMPAGAMEYDNNGNLKAGPGVTLTYTPDNLMKTSNANSVLTTFSYDADQWRAYKLLNSGEKSFFVRGLNGQLLSEMTNKVPATPSSGEARDYIYAGSRLIAVQKATDLPPR